MSFFRSKFVTTRKRHVCSWCGKGIEKGTVMERSAGVQDGEFWDAVVHPECAAARDATPWQELADGFYMEFPRGRNDEDFKAPPMFSADYRGREQTTTQ